MKLVITWLLLFIFQITVYGQNSQQREIKTIDEQHKGETTFEEFQLMKNLIIEKNKQIELENVKRKKQREPLIPFLIIPEMKVSEVSEKEILQNVFSQQQYFQRFVKAFKLEIEPDLELEASSNLVLPAPFDSRIDIYQLDPEIEEQFYFLQRTNDILCVIHESQLKLVGEQTYVLDISKKLGATFNLCEGQPYNEQPTVGIGTAFLIRNNMMVTANHVLEQYPLDELRLINRFEVISEKNDIRITFHANEIYKLKNKIGAQDLDQLDIALVELDRPSSFKGSQIKSDVTAQLNDQVYALGHPIGLPMKLTLNARIKSLDNRYFYTSLDTFQGNSGSPVYLRNTHELVGVLVSGGLDFEPNGDCFQSYLCVGASCGQERVLSINYLLRYMKIHLGN